MDHLAEGPHGMILLSNLYDKDAEASPYLVCNTYVNFVVWYTYSMKIKYNDDRMGTVQ